MVGLVLCRVVLCVFFFQAEDGIRDLVRSRGLGDVYKRQGANSVAGFSEGDGSYVAVGFQAPEAARARRSRRALSLIHI